MTPFTHLIGRKPFVIGGEDHPYLRRWWIIPRNRFFNVYLHQFLRSDDDRALHDHPWFNVSILVTGRYREWLTEDTFADRVAPTIVARSAETAHRIELTHGGVWTLFLTGRKVREWGFLCPKGWRHWTVFCNTDDGGATVGRGCE